MPKSLLLRPRLWAGILVLAAGYCTRLPKPPQTEVEALTKRFHFERTGLAGPSPEAAGPRRHLLAPAFQHLEGWLTAFMPTGAAMVDLAGTGAPEAVCLTEPFRREIWVRSLPGSKHPFADFRLELGALDTHPHGSVPTGCLPGDFNEDGKSDLLVYFWGRTPVVFLRNDRTTSLSAASFTPQALLPEPKRWYTQSITQADVTGSGHLDLVVANYFPDDAKVFDDEIPGESWMNKGWGAAKNGAQNRLLLNDGTLALGKDGFAHFHEAPDAFGAEFGGAQWTIAAAAVDMDGDLLPELFFVNDHGADRLLHNRSTAGQPRFTLIENRRDFTTPKSKTLGLDAFHGMGIDFGDLSQRGLLDWGVSNFGADYMFQQSHFTWVNTGDTDQFRHGRAPFRDLSEELGTARTKGVAWDLRMEDFDNSGSLQIFQAIGFMRGRINRTPELHELALENDLLLQYPAAWHRFTADDDLAGHLPNTFFVKRSNGQYTDIGAQLGFMEEGVSRGVATADVFGDGRVDLLVTNQHAAPSFYRNLAPQPGQFLGLDLRLPYHPAAPGKAVVWDGREAWNAGPAARPAIGTEVLVSLPDGRRVASFVDGGNGVGGKRTPQIHLGLGKIKADEVLNVKVAWRDASGQRRDQVLTMTPGWHTVWLGSGADVAEVSQ